MIRITSLALLVLLGVACLAAFTEGQEEEEEEGCRYADAAISYNHVNYIFVGQDYITLDVNNTEFAVAEKDTNWGGLGRLDAALNWQSSDWWYSYATFLEDGNYYYYSTFRTHGPFAVSSGNEAAFDPALNLDKGVDAAFSVGDKSYFIKWCDYTVYDSDIGEIETQGKLSEHGIPCNVHAALEVSEGVVGIIKFDKMWLVTAETFEVEGPLDANEYFGLETIKLCGEENDFGDHVEDE